MPTMKALVKKKSEVGLWLDEVPVPTMVEPVLSASLESLPHPIRRRKPRMRPNILWRIVDSRLTAAALVMLVIGGSIYAYKWRERQVLASAQTIEVIVEWNLKLVQADTPAERRKVYEASAGLLDQYVVSAPLTSDDRKRAGELIEKGAFLKDNEDPLAEADHFSGVADLLVKKMDLTADASPETMDKLSHTYLSVVDNGIEKNLDRAQAAAKDNPAGQNKIARIDQRNALLMDRVEALVEKHPTSSPPQLQRALAHQRQKSQQRKSEKR